MSEVLLYRRVLWNQVDVRLENRILWNAGIRPLRERKTLEMNLDQSPKGPWSQSVSCLRLARRARWASGSCIGRYMSGYLEKGIQTTMTRGRPT